MSPKASLLAAALTLSCCILATSARAQAYKSAVGLRLGTPVAVTFKHYLNEGSAVEAFSGVRSSDGFRWFSLSLAYQSSYSLGLDGALAPLSWYWGAGASLYQISFSDRELREFLGADGRFNLLGINGYLGLEYTFDNLPITATVDWVPTYYTGDLDVSGFGIAQAGVGVRYILR